MTGTTSIMTPPPLSRLQEAGPVSLFLDFDGTLVDIASSPDAIFVPGDLAPRLESLSARMHGRVALVSGRSLDNLASYLGGDLAVARAGSHGLERKCADGTLLGDAPAAFPDAVRMAVAQFAGARKGLHYEAKSFGAALHYRAAPDCKAACRAFAAELAALYDLEVKRGKCVEELVSREADKGAALRAFMLQKGFAGSVPIFIGDDVTDEDGFCAAMELGGFGIVVGTRQNSCATYRLEAPAKVYEWLNL